MAMRLQCTGEGTHVTIEAGGDSSIERASPYGSEGWGFESFRARTRDSLRANGSGRDSRSQSKITSQQASQQLLGRRSDARSTQSETPFLPSTMTRIPGGGPLRERRSGVWEVRVSLGADPVSGRSRVRSLWPFGVGLGPGARRHPSNAHRVRKPRGHHHPQGTTTTRWVSWPSVPTCTSSSCPQPRPG